MAAVKAKPQGWSSWPGGDAFQFSGQGQRPQQHPMGRFGTIHHHTEAAMDAMAQIDMDVPGLAEERFVVGRAAPLAVTGEFCLAISFGSHDQTP